MAREAHTLRIGTMFAMPHPVFLPGSASSALFWLIGGGLVLLSLQLRRFQARPEESRASDAAPRREPRA
jgi:hypothetical protein